MDVLNEMVRQSAPTTNGHSPERLDPIELIFHRHIMRQSMMAQQASLTWLELLRLKYRFADGDSINDDGLIIRTSVEP